jgi:uncharacterized protein YndB with AHSA1/START domain
MLSRTVWHMRSDQFEVTVQVDAPADRLWQAVADVERWPQWTRSMQDVRWLETHTAGSPLRVGARARIKQPGRPRLVWEVSELMSGASFTWRAASPGVTATATHVVRPLSASRAELILRVRESGPLAPVVGMLTGRRTRRFVRLEADGLKRCAEALS